MTSDVPDSGRKHRKSSDDEADKSLKRHKHRRHHHHHRRHRHRHSSKKLEEEDTLDGGDVAPPQSSHQTAVPSGNHLDDDLEEGEILDEEGDGATVTKKRESDVESGEWKAVQAFNELDNQNLGDSALKSTGSDDKCGFHVEEYGRSARNSKIVMEDRGDDALVNYSILEDEYISNRQRNNTLGVKRNDSTEPQHDIFTKDSSVGLANVGYGSNRGELEKRFEEFLHPATGNGKRKRYDDDDDDHTEDYKIKASNLRKSSSPESVGDKTTALVCSLSRDKTYDVLNARSRSMSHDHARETSRSDSIIEEEVPLKRRDIDNNETACDSVGERPSRYSSRDLSRHGRREHSASNSSHARDGDKHHSLEAWQVYGIRDRDMEMTQKKEKEPDRSSGEEMIGDRRDKERERKWDRVMRKEKEEERSREKERQRSREKDRERSREKDIERKREKERERSRERELERDRRRQNERGGSRDKPRVSNRYVDRERERENKADNGRDGIWDRRRESEREKLSNRSRDKVRNNRKMYEYYEDGYGDRDSFRHSRNSRHDETDSELDRKRKNDSHNSRNADLEKLQDRQKKDEDEQEDFEERVASQLADQEEEDLGRIKEESRRRRQAILEKYKNQQLQQAILPQREDVKEDKEPSGDPSDPSAFAVLNLKAHEGKSDDLKVHVTDLSNSVEKSPLQNGFVAPRNPTVGGLGEGTPKSERSDDMFRDDIFGESPAGVRKSVKGDGLQIEKGGLHDNWDDADGYYSYRFGEVLDGRYEVISAHGKGVFSTVVRARDLKSGVGETEEVAIKIIRSNLTKACVQELGILKKLVGADPEDKRHCVRFLSSFKYRNHLCLVFESLHMNLREVLKKFGRNIGLKLTAVRTYSKQLFIALKHLRNCGVLHCDIKPDNMLVNEAKNVLKVCDFGNAMFAGKNEITPYLVSRFYRAPEIILGLPYDHPLDIWSVGCCLYELYTGKVLFPGATNNDMLRLHMELKGLFPKKMLRKGGFIDQHFDQDLNFHATEEDHVTKKTIKRIVLNVKPKDIGSIIPGSLGEDPKMVANFRDLLDKIFVLDPDKRLTVSQALNHPFITVLWRQFLACSVKGVVKIRIHFTGGSWWSVLFSIDLCNCFEATLQFLDA